MIDNSELIIKKHQLKLEIQKVIVEELASLKSTNDIGKVSWEIAEKVIENIMRTKQASKNVNKILKKVVDINKTTF